MNKSMKRSMINNNVWYKSMLVGNIPSDYELIATANGNGSSGTIDFSSIPADYKHLQLRWTARNTGNPSSGYQWIYLRFNDQASSIYRSHYLQGQTTGLSSQASNSATEINLRDSMGLSNDTTGAVHAGVLDILDYVSTTKNTTIRAIYGKESNLKVFSGFMNNQAAVTKISLIAGVGAYSTISRFSLYGIRG
jgi:hypothetical protein